MTDHQYETTWVCPWCDFVHVHRCGPHDCEPPRAGRGSTEAGRAAARAEYERIRAARRAGDEQWDA